MAQPPRSIYCSTLINPQEHSLVSFHASFIFPKIAPAFLRENAHALRKFFIHRGKIIQTLEHSLRLSEVSSTLGHTLSMVVSWTISTYSFSTLRFLIFSHFPSFCPAVAFRLVFPTMTHGCSTDVDHPASPRATRAPYLGILLFLLSLLKTPLWKFLSPLVQKNRSLLPLPLKVRRSLTTLQ